MITLLLLMIILIPISGVLTVWGLIGMLIMRKSTKNPQQFIGMKHLTWWGLGLIAVSVSLSFVLLDGCAGERFSCF